MLPDRKREPVRYAGKEICEIKPVILGGSPTDPANKVILDRKSHIKMVCYWNKIIRQLPCPTQKPHPGDLGENGEGKTED